MQISAPIQRGNSGGPVFDQAYNVIDVVVSKLDTLIMVARSGTVRVRCVRWPVTAPAAITPQQQIVNKNKMLLVFPAQTPATPQPRTTTRNDKRASRAWETCPELVEGFALRKQQLNHL